MKKWFLEEKKSLVYYGVMLLDFYLMPFLMKDTGSAMVLLLIVMPIICFLDSVIYSVKNGFRPGFVLVTAALFIPSIFIFYNSSAWVYVIGYGIIALIGSGAGVFFHGRKK